MDKAKDSPLARVLRDRLTGPGHAEWTVTADEVWYHVRPRDYRPREQGWKLHVSATVGSAAVVLERVLDVLVPARCGFKFAGTPAMVRELNSGRYSRGAAGKFVTVYPADDEQFRTIADLLDRATDGLAGPVILSDRPLRPGSLVHYRYGAFVGRQLLTNDGEYLEAIAAPDGTLVEDRRDPWFTPPSWAQAPIPVPAADPVAPDGVLLADRFVVHRAIRHANKGGVFEATDRATGGSVIVKQARAHVGDGAGGWEMRDALRNEARMLDLLSPLRLAPRPLALVEQGGDLFLAQERIDGTTLAAWRAGTVGDRLELPWPTVVDVVTGLIDLLDNVHTLGVVVRDLTPTNVMVRPDGSLSLVDLEFAAKTGDAAPTIGTPGYAPPEQHRGAPADDAADRYALGALIWLLSTGIDPLLLPDHPSDRSGPRGLNRRFADWLSLIAVTNETADRARPLILGLLAEEPADRWSLDRARTFLRGSGTPPAGGSAAAPRPAPEIDRLLTDGVDYLLSAMTPDRERLWPVSEYGSRSDACNVQHGAAGVLATLTWLATDPPPGTDAARIHAAIRSTAGWIERRLAPEQAPLPGLYFGRAGTAWALYDAASVLDDHALAARAVDLATRLPLDWPNADVTHGLAGAGYTMLHLWRATGRPELADRARRYASTIAARVQRRDGLLLWPVPDDFASRLAGLADHGFAHGTAGIGAYLLDAGRLLDEPGWIDLAAEAGAGLAGAAHENSGTARWTSGPRDRVNLLEYWCSGSAGIGTFLVRLWKVTGDRRIGDLAAQAAAAVWQWRWRSSAAVCHGLAGNGDFLLDMADATGEDRYRAQAEGLAAAIAVRATVRDGRLLAPDETLTGFGADYGVGVAGWVGYLLRLRHGGPRRWMADR